MFPDDCLIYEIVNSWENLVPKIQEGLDHFQQWCHDNRLKLNVKKLKSLVIGTTFKMKNLDLCNRFKLNNTKL